MTITSNTYFLPILGCTHIRSTNRNCFHVLRPNVIFCNCNTRSPFDFCLTLLRIAVSHYIINVMSFVFSYFNEFIVTCCKCIKNIFESCWFIVCRVNFAVKSVISLLYGFPSTNVFLAVFNKYFYNSLLVFFCSVVFI